MTPPVVAIVRNAFDYPSVAAGVRPRDLVTFIRAFGVTVTYAEVYEALRRLQRAGIVYHRRADRWAPAAVRHVRAGLWCALSL